MNSICRVKMSPFLGTSTRVGLYQINGMFFFLQFSWEAMERDNFEMNLQIIFASCIKVSSRFCVTVVIFLRTKMLFEFKDVRAAFLGCFNNVRNCSYFFPSVFNLFENRMENFRFSCHCITKL